MEADTLSLLQWINGFGKNLIGGKRNVMKNLILIFVLFVNCFVFPKKVLVFGGEKGWIGQKIVEIFKAEGFEVFSARSRLEDRQYIIAEIDEIAPDFVINSAGITGKPTIDWCESNKEQTIRSNVLGLINLVDVCCLKNIHVTNLSTGCIYQYDDKHSISSGIGFKENEEPNFSGSFYSATKIIAEKIISNYKNVLNLRIRMPISSDLNPRSFIGKIIRYKKLLNMPNSMTILDDLLPLIPKMINWEMTGTFNFVNPGTITHEKIIKLYQKFIDPSHTYEIVDFSEQKQILQIPRSNCELDASKILSIFPNIPSINDSIINVFYKIKKSSND